MPENRGSIWLQQGTYNALKQGKEQYETQVGGKVDWGAFLLLLLGLHIANQVLKPQQKSKEIGKGMQQQSQQQQQTKRKGVFP